MHATDTFAVELLFTAELPIDELATELDVDVVATSDFALLELALELEPGKGDSLVLFLSSLLLPQPLSSAVRLIVINRKDNFIFSIPFIC